MGNCTPEKMSASLAPLVLALLAEELACPKGLQCGPETFAARVAPAKMALIAAVG